jgi:outer membrane biosynthesis protein TonB
VRAERLPRAAFWAGLTGTFVIHAGAVLALLLSIAGAPKPSPPMYAVELVAAPAALGAARPAAAARPTPPPAAAPIPKTKAAPLRSSTTAAPKTKAAKTSNPVTPLPGETPGTGSDIANVDLKGKQFPYPEYLRNLVAQIYRRWNRPTNNAPLTAEVGFVILRDGTVKDIQMLASSRSFSFDQEARAAIDVAGAAKAFGPLPAGYPADYLQISFVFTPRRTP